MANLLDSYSVGDKISLKGILQESSIGTAKNGTKFARGTILVDEVLIKWIGFDRRHAPNKGSEVKLQGEVSVYKEEKQIEVTAIQEISNLGDMSKTRKLIAYYRNCIEKEYQGSVVKVDLSNSPTLKQEGEGLVESMRTSTSLTYDENSTEYIWFKKITLTGEDTNVMLGYPILKKTFNDGTKKFAPLAFIDTNVKADKGIVTITRVSDSISWNYGALELLGVPLEERDHLKEKLSTISDEYSYDTERLSSGIAELENYLGVNFAWETRFELAKHQAIDNLEVIYSREVCFDGQANSVYEYLLKDLGELLNKSDIELARGPLGVVLFGLENKINEDELLILTPLQSNLEQTKAIRSAFASVLSCVTGPPGTGKSQFVANLASTALANKKTVLIASKNNQAVDVAINRIKRATPTSWPIRSGNRENRKLAASKLFESINSDHSHEDVNLAIDELNKVNVNIDILESLLNNYDTHLFDLNNKKNKCSESIELLNTELSGMESSSIEMLESELYEIRLFLLKPLNFFMKNKQINNRKIVTIEKFNEISKKLNLTFPNELINEITFKYSKNNMDVLEPMYNWKNKYKSKFNILNEFKAELASCIADLNSCKSMDQIENEIENAKIEQNELSNKILKVSWDILVNSSSKIKNLEILSLGLGSGFTSNLKSNLNTGLKVAPIWGVTNLSAWGNFPLEDGLFDLVIIDEASQCDIPSILPLLFRAKRAILVGDPNQLQHITSLKPRESKIIADNLQLGDISKEGYSYTENSAFMFCRRFTEVSSTLKEHYRSHPAIAEFANKFVYKGELEILTDPLSYKKGDGIFWHDLNGKSTGNGEGGSLKNIDEAKMVIKLLLELREKLDTKSYGIVTPFKAQSELITDMISRNKSLDDVEIRVATAHKFQGDEKDVIIMSTVVSDLTSIFKKDFANNLNLVNVAVTRARRQLHIVGSSSVCTDIGGLLGSLANYSQSLQKMGFESPAEESLYNALDRSKYDVTVQENIADYRVDFLITKKGSEIKLVVECDGHPFHRNMVRDKIRDEYLFSNGYKVLHVSARDALKKTRTLILKIDDVFN